MRGDTNAFAAVPSSGRVPPQHVPPTQEGTALLYGILALTFVQFHPSSPTGDTRLFAWFGLNFLLLFVGPALIIRFVWKRRLRDYGVQWGNAATWGRYFLAFFLLMVPVALISSRNPDFHAYYPRAEMARLSVGGWALSAAGWLVYFFAWEFFFRGFLLFTLAPRYGGAIAVLIQMIPFAMAHYAKLEAEAWSAIFCGIALGVMAYRGRSFVGTWLLHWAVATLMDVCVLLWPLGPS